MRAASGSSSRSPRPSVRATGRNDEARVGDGGELNVDDAVGELVGDLVRQRESQASLADPAGTRDREQAYVLAVEELAQGCQLLPAADQLRRRDGTDQRPTGRIDRLGIRSTGGLGTPRERDARRLDQLATARVARRGRLRQRLRDHFVEPGGQLVAPLADRGGASSRWPYITASSGAPPKRRLARQALVEHAAQRVDVGAVVDFAALDLLGGDGVERAHHLPVGGEAAVGAPTSQFRSRRGSSARRRPGSRSARSTT